MTALWQFMALLAVHWLGDFVAQTHWQASNKSKNNEALARHMVSYGVILLAGGALIFDPITAWLIAVINVPLHWGTDYFTCRWSSKLYAQQRWHDFFVVIGLDQLIHQAALATSIWALA